MVYTSLTYEISTQIYTYIYDAVQCSKPLGRPTMSYHVLEAAADDFLTEAPSGAEGKAARAFARHVLAGRALGPRWTCCEAFSN